MASQGFTKAQQPYDLLPKFTLQSGPRNPDPNMTPLDAVRKFLTKEVCEVFVNNAKNKSKENNYKLEASSEGFIRYYCAVIAHGLVQYQEEKDAYVASKSSIGGLLGNPMLKSLHTFQEWQQAKVIYSTSKDQITIIFNEKSDELWVHCQ